MKRFMLLCVLCLPLRAAAADKTWANGILLSYDQQTFTTYSQSGGTGQDHAHTTYRIQLDAGSKIYFLERTLSWRWQQFPKVTENAPISWALKGDKELLLKDETGKEFTLTVVKTRLKNALGDNQLGAMK